MEDVLIIGAGTAGLTAAIYARRAGLSCTVFEQGMPGGKIVSSPEIANYPALPKVSGYDYTMALLGQAKDCGAKMVMERVTGADLSGEIKTLSTSSGLYEGKTVILANGAFRRKLGVKGEKELEGRGVSYCATCDGAFFRQRKVAVIGGGDTAFEDAAYLSGICEKVYLIVRENDFSASETLTETVLNRENVTVLKNSVTEEITGEKFVTGVLVKDKKKGESMEIPLSAVFVAVGIAPDNATFEGIALDEHGYVLAGEDCLTNIPGVFAAGDTRKKELRQLVTAAADGAVAATAAFRFIRGKAGK